jgi:CheY-like chemotaxis protein
MPVRVLIVDDQEPFRLAARMVVDVTDGFEVVGEAETGEDGVSMANDLHPDLVLMDVNLPGIDGLEATRRIRVRWPQSGPRIAAMTANALAEDREACLAAGMDDYLTKPIKVEELAAALERASLATRAASAASPAP